jgi:hypothetical protein
MKSTLQVLLLALGATCACAAFIGLIGIDSAVAFLTSETAFWLYPVVGLMLIGFNDYSRRPVIVLAPATKACPVPAVGPGRRANAYGISRRTCVVA